MTGGGFTLFRPSPARAWAEAAFAQVTAAARAPGLYRAGVPDTMDGRFEMLVLHGAAAFLRLKGEPAAERLADAFADRFFRGLDDGLRELGVGDLSVPRAMKGLAQRVYGRIAAYEAGLAAPDPQALAAAVARNVFNAEAPTPAAAALGDHLRACRDALAARPAEAIADAAVWPAFAARPAPPE